MTFAITKSSLKVIGSLLVVTVVSSCVNAGPTKKEVFPDNIPVINPPFQKNKTFLIGQSFHGRVSHQGALNAYAVDLAMPKGEPVCAVKAGTVSALKDVDQAMKADKRFREDNFVLIKHNDKTWSVYGHLAPGSISVKKRQKIKKGECFASVGNTGYSTAPHLHMALLTLKREEKRFVSIPFRFMQRNGKATVPRYLRWVRN